MSILTLFRHTPLWVWILLFFLIKRGLRALKDRQMAPHKLFLLPLVFFIWGVWSVTNAFAVTPQSVATFAAGLVAGLVTGWVLWRSTPGLKNVPGSTFIIRPGTPITLILIVVNFVVKYTLSVMLATQPALQTAPRFTLLFCLITGVMDGIFWGGTLNLLWRWRKTQPLSGQSAG